MVDKNHYCGWYCSLNKNQVYFSFNQVLKSKRNGFLMISLFIVVQERKRNSSVQQGHAHIHAHVYTLKGTRRFLLLLHYIIITDYYYLLLLLIVPS
jgi:hypothetical protein